MSTIQGYLLRSINNRTIGICFIFKQTSITDRNSTEQLTLPLNKFPWCISLESPWDSFDILPDLAASCYGLEKLSIKCHNEHTKVEDKDIFGDPILSIGYKDRREYIYLSGKF